MKSDDRSIGHEAGCSEYRGLSRRAFLGTAAAASAPLWMPRIALGAPGGADSRDAVIFVFLRGGMDALSAVVPYGDGALYAARPTLAVPAAQVIDLDGFFGLSPALAALERPYRDGRLAFVHAAGSPDPTRSHFDAMARIETATPNQPALTNDGWLARQLAGTAPLGSGGLRALALGNLVPRLLARAPGTLPVPDPATFAFPGETATAAARRASIEGMYAVAPPPAGPAAASALATIDLLEAIDFANYQPQGGAVYPGSNFGSALASTAAMLKHGLSLEAVAIDFGGWDHHSNMGPLTGLLASMLDDLGRALDAFELDMRGHSARWTLVVQSEFGRRVAENGSGGLDHGHGTCLFVMGEHVAGGRVVRNWPGLAPGQLDNGDLAVTIDYRDVMYEILAKRVGDVDLAIVFPAYTPTALGLTV